MSVELRSSNFEVCFVAVLFASAVLAAQTQPQQPPVFRGGTTIVPLTVTVLDKNGAPVKDLKASDFTVIENKKTREIVNFFPQELAPGPVPAGDVVPAHVRGQPLAPQTRRAFLIVLGYGYIEHPTDALEGAIDLVRNRLLPQDIVAVMGFHRTTAFTTDHERIAQVLERYRKEHEKIVGEITNYRSMARAPVVGPVSMAGAIPSKAGTSAPPGNAPIPDKILKRIDEIFLGPAAAGGPASDPAFLRHTTDLLMAMDRVVPIAERPSEYHQTFGGIQYDLRARGEGLTDAVLLSSRLKLYAGVEYLRDFEGDKHLVFMAGGSIARSVDEAQVFARRATDARVVVDVVNTGGTPTGPFDRSPAADLAFLTGGFYSSVDLAAKAVGKIDEATRFSYLLGYAPSNPDLDGTYRTVSVIVNRPDVTVRFRHGYFAAEEPPPVELEALVKKARIETALAYDQQAKDIPLRATVTMLPRMGIEAQVRVDLTIDAAPLGVVLKDGVRTGQLELQVYCGDAKQAVIGDAGEHYDISTPEATYQQWLQTGIRRTIRIPVADAPKFVKVVVYDYGSDRIGSVMVTIK